MTSPFDSQPDESLGRLLREHLSAQDHEAFVARVRAAIMAAAPDTAWDVLARWMRPGLVAAAAVALAFGLWMGIGDATGTEVASLADAVQQAGVPGPLLPGAEGDAVLAAIVGER